MVLLAGQSTGCHAGDAAVESVTPRRPAVHTLHSDKLVVEVMDPNDPQRYNRGVRFAPLAAVLSVRMNGHEFLFHPDEHDPIADHGGLPAEFDLVAPGDPASWMPPGYNEARIGEGFVKIGVGVLKKDKKRYSLFQQPKVIALAQTTAEWYDDHAEFTQICQGIHDYAYTLRAKLRCQNEQVVIEWELENTGSKPLVTRQYIHNFFRFDDYDVGPNYELAFPYDFQATGLESQQHQIGRTILFERCIPRWVNMVVPYPQDRPGPCVCTLRQTKAKMAVSCETSLPLIRTAIHARPTYVSPEQFIELHIDPGENVQWTRTYRFQLLP